MEQVEQIPFFQQTLGAPDYNQNREADSTDDEFHRHSQVSVGSMICAPSEVHTRYLKGGHHASKGSLSC